MRSLVVAAVALLLAGCSPLTLLNAIVPSDYALQRGLPYGPAERQKLDVYRPVGLNGPLPAVVFFYGGDWRSGSREQYAFVAEALSSRGFVVVIPDYRLYPEVRYPDFLRDGALAVRWTVDHAAQFGINPASLHLMGHSAGAYIAMMLTLNEQYLGEVGLQLSAIKSTAGLAGPYDFLPIERDDIRVVFDPPVGPETQPITYVDGNEQPILLVQGLADQTVDPGNAVRLAARIQSEGGRVELKTYAGVGHSPLVTALASPFRWIAPVLDDVSQFFRGVN